MASENIIFRIGSSMGPGGFASIQAAGSMLVGLANKIEAVVAENDKFSQAYRRLTIDISEADSATKGLIDTYAMMQMANKMQQAGVKMTETDFKNAMVAATDYAKATGGDATEAAKRLTDSISKGSTRALKEMGIDLKNTEDLSLAQAEALEKLAIRADGLTIEIETATESFYVLGNNVGTFTGLLWDSLKSMEHGDGVVGTFNSVLAEMNAELMASPEAFMNYNLSLDAVVEGVMEAGVSIVEYLIEPLIRIQELLGFTGGAMRQWVTTMRTSFEEMKSNRLAVYEIEKAIEEKKVREEKAGRKQRQFTGLGKGSRGKGKGKGEGEGFGEQSELDDAMVFNDLAAEGAEAPDYSEWGPDSEMQDAQTFDSMAKDLEVMHEKIEATIELEDLEKQTAQARANRAVERQYRYDQLMEQEMMLEDMRLDAALRREEEELQRLFVLEESINLSQQWADAWNSAMGKVSAGGLAATGVMDVMHASVAAGVNAAIKGQQSFAEGLRQAVVQVGSAIAIEAGFNAALQVAFAMADFARPFGTGAAEGALHMASAAQFLATAVIAGGAAGIAHAAAPSGASAPSGSPGSGPGSAYEGGGSSSVGSAPSYRGGDQQEVNVSIELKDGEEGLFRAVVNQSNQASQDGDNESAFATKSDAGKILRYAQTKR